MESKTRLTITDECNCCGMCGVKYPDYFCENAEGRATIKDGVLILDTEKAAEVQKVCPVHAITSVKEEKSIRQMLSDAVDNLKACKLAYPTEAEIPFKKEEYHIPTPSASGEYEYKYSSESSANSAARKEFDRKMYSHINSLILKVITEYRMKYIKPYYSKDETSVYAVCNKKVEEILRGICQILKAGGLAGDLPDDFANVSVFPDEKDSTWKMLNKGELISDEMVSTIREEFDSGSYSSLESYKMYWETDCMEDMYVGKGFFGGDKYEDRYYYYHLWEAFNELAKDILDACHYKDDYIVEHASEVVQWLIDQYNEKLEKLINERIDYLDKKIGGGNSLKRSGTAGSPQRSVWFSILEE